MDIVKGEQEKITVFTYFNDGLDLLMLLYGLGMDIITAHQVLELTFQLF